MLHTHLKLWLILSTLSLKQMLLMLLLCFWHLVPNLEMALNKKCKMAWNCLCIFEVIEDEDEDEDEDDDMVRVKKTINEEGLKSVVCRQSG